jgi:hypothetical protein
VHAEIRARVEGTTRSYRSIGTELGVAACTVSRHASREGWRRPPGAALPTHRLPGSPGDRSDQDARERITEKLWRLAERHAEELEDQPLEIAQRALQPLARLTRTLGEMNKHIGPPLPAYQYEIDAPKRTIHELRDELQAHLERIVREERDYEERWTWSFENGAGI